MRLAGGTLMPMLGLGVWRIPGGETERAVRWALEAGYRHVDTAAAYGNEEGVGLGVRGSGLPRDDVFVATKLRPGRGPARRQLEESLRKLGLDHVNLYLIHWAGRGAEHLWPEMERLHADGLARAIGVSNYGPELLRRTVASARVPPMVNQIEWHAGAFSPAELSAHRELGVVLESYSPLGHGRLLDHPGVAEVAGRLGRHAGPGARALVPGAGRPHHPQVAEPRAHRGERGRPRPGAERRGHGPPRRAPRRLTAGRGRRGRG